MKLSKALVADKVRERLVGVHPGGVTLEVVEKNIYQIDQWWRVPIRPSRWPERVSDFYESLAEVATDLLEKDHLDVIFFTGAPLEEEAEALAA